MRAYKLKLDLNNKQRTACLQHAGAARWAYNYGLGLKIEARKVKAKTPTAVDLHKEIVLLKHTTHPWLTEISKCAPQQALRNLDVAYKNFFRRCKTGAKKKGFPKFKSRKQGIGSFLLEGTIKTTNKTIKLPRIGEVRLAEYGYVPTNVVIKSVVISERAGRWFIAVRTTEEVPKRTCGSEILGVDVGTKNLIVLSDGTVFKNPKALKASEQVLRRRQKSVSRKVKGSSNRRKATAKLAKQHYRVACIRSDTIHKATTAISKQALVIGIETLNVAGMMKNHCLAKALSDAAMAEIHRQLIYKMKWSGGQVIKADRFYPSSKTCSACGRIKDDLALSDRVFICDGCGLVIDRDLNAAINLKKLAESSSVSACCPGSSGQSNLTKLLVGQEPSATNSVGIGG